MSLRKSITQFNVGTWICTKVPHEGLIIERVILGNNLDDLRREKGSPAGV